MWSGLQGRRADLVTTSLVLAESHGLLARRVGASAGFAFLRTFTATSGGGGRVVWADEELTSAAIDRWLLRYRDQAFSLTDAVSFEVMQREGIREAFAFDEDFVRAGFAIAT